MLSLNQKSSRRICILLLCISLIVYLLCFFSQQGYYGGTDARVQGIWWHYIYQHGFDGISTLNRNGADYTCIWYFIIYLFTALKIYPFLSHVLCLKIIAAVCSILSSALVYAIIKWYRPHARFAPTAGFIAALYSPPLLLDLIKANAPDSLYIMLALLSLLLFVKGHKVASYFVLGFGICYKLMAIYLLPFFLYFYIKDFKKYSVAEKCAPLAILASVCLCSIPNVLAGGSFLDGIILPLVGRASPRAIAMANNSFTLWMLLPNNTAAFSLFSVGLISLLFFILFLFLFYFIPESRKRKVEWSILLPLCPMLCYYILPAQHEGYFALSCIFSLFMWFVYPKLDTLLPCLALNSLLSLGYVLTAFHYKQFQKSLDLYVLVGSFLFLFILIYYGCLLFKNSVFSTRKE